MDYATLGEADLVTLRRERLAELEADHYRTALRLAEGDPQVELLQRQLAEMERRIALYLAAPPEDLPDAAEPQLNGRPIAAVPSPQ